MFPAPKAHIGLAAHVALEPGVVHRTVGSYQATAAMKVRRHFFYLKRRQEGRRLKQRCHHNSLKAYEKAYTPVGSVLRIETTLNDPTDFKVFRPKEGGPAEELAWRPLRKGVADLYRRFNFTHDPRTDEWSLKIAEAPQTPAHIDAELRLGKAPSHWVIMGRREADLGALVHDSRWTRLGPRAHPVVWSDDFSNPLALIHWLR